jgi:L-ascorbate metabolism protein UlaG (beta-lactamase superfamily)
MGRQRFMRIGIVAAVVLGVAAALLLATRGSQPPATEIGSAGPNKETSAAGAAGGTAGPSRSPVSPSPAATGPTTGGGTAATEELPPGHPAVEPAPDEKSQVSIQWIGQSEFYIQSPQQIVVVTDPFDPAFTGYSDSKSLAHIVTVSHEHRDHNATQYVQPFTAMGEREVRVVRDGAYHRGDVTVTAIPSFHDSQAGALRGPNRIFLIEAGSLRIAHLGDLGQVLTPAQVQALGRVDVLLIPVGGYFTVGPDEAAEVVRQLNPRLVIPMHYRTAATKPEIGARLKSERDFTVKFPNVEFKDDYVALVALNTLPKTTTIWVLKYRGQEDRGGA